jgi:DNA-binding transcriptional regulator YbjK
MDVSELFDKSSENTQLSPEERIRLAALECIEELGLKEATVRAIAAKANMNPAAVNYYFRSKDRLVEEALQNGERSPSPTPPQEPDLFPDQTLMLL